PVVAVTAAKTQQQTQIVGFEDVGQLRRIVGGQQSLRAAEEDIAGEVHAVELLLQRPTQPVAENRILQIEDRLVEKRDNGKNRLLGVLGVVAQRARLLLSASQGFLDLVAKDVRVG